MPADLVIVNADLPFATKCLLSIEKTTTESRDSYSNDILFDWDDRFDFSSGVIAFHWSLNKRLDDLNTHNVFLVAGSRSQAEFSWRVLRKGFPSDIASLEPFNFYVHRASNTDPTAAPEGCDAIMILVPCKTLSRKEEYASLSRNDAMKEYAKQFDDDCINQARAAVLRRLSVIPSLQNLKDCILHEFVDTPASYADLYNLAAGAPFSLVSMLWKV
jgi:phytoene desaturase (3,4-didehydrolycopene-forming)